MYTIVLDVNGKYLGETNENGKVRHLIKDNKVKVINKKPFTIQILDADFVNITLIDSNESNKELSLTEQVIKSIEMIYRKLNNKELVNIIPLVQDLIAKQKREKENFTLMDIANYLYMHPQEDAIKIGTILKNNNIINEIVFKVIEEPIEESIKESNIEKEDININDMIISNIEAICGKQSATMIEDLNFYLNLYIISLKDNKFDLVDFSDYLLDNANDQIKEIGKTLSKYKNVLSNISFNIVYEDNANWNFIPLGKTIETNQKIGWLLNNLIAPEDIYLTVPSTSFLLIDKDRLESVNVIKKIIKYADQNCDKYQIVLSDLKKIVSKDIKEEYVVKGYTSDIDETLNMLSTAKKIIMQRLKLMEEQNVNNINSISSDLNVNYYNIGYESFQFDDIIEMEFEDGYKEFITVEDLYNEINEGSINDCGYTIEKTQGKFKPRETLVIINCIDELIAADSKTVDKIKANLESIVRLGLAANVHLFIIAKYPIELLFSKDLLNNISIKLILGDFNSNTSKFIFNKDISNKAKPDTPGRGFLLSGKDIIEVQI